MIRTNLEPVISQISLMMELNVCAWRGGCHVYMLWISVCLYMTVHVACRVCIIMGVGVSSLLGMGRNVYGMYVSICVSIHGVLEGYKCVSGGVNMYMCLVCLELGKTVGVCACMLLSSA